MNIIIKVNEKTNFKKRANKFLMINLFIALAIFIFIVFSSWEAALILASYTFITQYIRSLRFNKYFITYIEKNDEQLKIIYHKKGEEKEITGNILDFIVKKKRVFSRNRSTYLAVYYSGNLLLRQYETGDWKEKTFDDMIKKINT